jgi:D-aminoacyl-tRNA deacylase
MSGELSGLTPLRLRLSVFSFKVENHSSQIGGFQIKWSHDTQSWRFSRPGWLQVIAVLQRVSEARVEVAGRLAARIGRGLLVLVAVRPADDEASALRLLDRLLKYRIFADEAGKMNLSLQHIAGDLLLVPQFTLAADTRHGLRPGFSTAAPSEQGKRLFESLVSAAKTRHSPVSSGVFGAHMQVSLTNDGPVTFWLES